VHGFGQRVGGRVERLLQRALGVPYDRAQPGGYLLAVHEALGVAGVEDTAHQPLVVALGEFPLGEGRRERLDLGVRHQMPHDRADQGGVQATAQVQADLHVGLQTLLDRTDQ
jgi:hypothetical protein